MKKTFKVVGMDCDSCAKMIELDLEDAGIDAKCSFPKQTLEVELTEKSDENKINEIITKSGYSISAN
jgi:copper chaperone CopZ